MPVYIVLYEQKQQGVSKTGGYAGSFACGLKKRKAWLKQMEDSGGNFSMTEDHILCVIISISITKETGGLLWVI